MGCSGSQNSTDPSKKQQTIGHENVIQKSNRPISEYYKFGKKLGQGSFGEVKEATHKTSGEKRAVKIVKKSLLTKKSELDKEFNILRGLDHPNIMKIYEAFEDKTAYFFVTEILAGGELYDQICNLEQWNEKQAAELIRQLISSVCYCHDKNIAHRDIKPENILLEKSTKEGKAFDIKLVDFGMAKYFDKLKKYQEKLGSPLYMAPEIVRGESYDMKCDIWSLGIILYILLSGSVPFKKTGNQAALFNEIKLCEFTMADLQGVAWDGVSREGKDFVLRMLAKTPKKRASAAELLKHPWMKKQYTDHHVSENSQRQIFGGLKKFNAEYKLQFAAFDFISTQLTRKEDVNELRNIFQKLDKSGDGKLSFEELEEGFESLRGELIKSKEDLRELFKKVDKNQSGHIDYHEFITATIDYDKLLNEENLKMAFELFDKNKDGRITADEIKSVLENGNCAFDDKMVAEIIGELDENKDNEISYDEFKNIMTIKH